MNPFFIEGPAVVSFSGGRTSAYMLRRILDAGLQPNVHVLFANTGKERNETLDFVHECETRWKVPITWLEYRQPTQLRLKGDGSPFLSRYRKPTWEVKSAIVDYFSASRLAEPYTAFVNHRQRLPNRMQRICTEELKIRPMREHMKAIGNDYWDMVIGLRADEPRRVAKMRGLNETGTHERWLNVMPLADAGVTHEEVLSFWKAQDFDLQLKTWEGNCDLCFLKTPDKIMRMIQDGVVSDETIRWWTLLEEKNYSLRGERFSRDRFSYAELAERALSMKASGKLVVLNDAPDDDTAACMVCID